MDEVGGLVPALVHDEGQQDRTMSRALEPLFEPPALPDGPSRQAAFPAGRHIASQEAHKHCKSAVRDGGPFRSKASPTAVIRTWQLIFARSAILYLGLYKIQRTCSTYPTQYAAYLGPGVSFYLM